MANSTDPFAQSVHGTNPQYLIEKITRLKIYNSTYWKEECFGLTSSTIIDKAIALKYCGGNYGGNIKPTQFLCLVLKLLQLQPEKEIILEFIKNDDFVYLRLLGAFYLRLTGKADDIYNYLEPLYNDYRKLRYRGMSGWKSMYVDEFIDSLIHDELVCDVALPYLVKRMKLEEMGTLSKRLSVLDVEIDDAEKNFVDNDIKKAVKAKSKRVESIKIEDTNDTHINTKDNLNSAVSFNDDSSDDQEDNSKKIIEESKNHTQSKDKSSHYSDDDRDSSSERNDKRNSPSRNSRDRHHRDRRNESPINYGEKDNTRDYRDYDRRDRNRHDSRERGGYRRDSRDRHRRYSRDRSPRDSRGRDRSRRNGSRDRRHHEREYEKRKSDQSTSPYRRSKRENDDHYEEDSREKRSRRDDSRSRHDSKDTMNDSNDNKKELVDETLRKTNISNSKVNKKFDKMFKSKSSKDNEMKGKEITTENGTKVLITAPEGSVEYWNQIRASLGMKQLK
eukprot:gene7537-10271_t